MSIGGAIPCNWPERFSEVTILAKYFSLW